MTPPRISSLLSRASACYLGVIGFALLFAADEILPGYVPGFPRSAAWIGQLIAGGWLGAAMLNWNGRENILGGIYGRPQVILNLLLYMVSALALLRAGLPMPLLAVLTVPMSLFALAYAAVFLRGPFDRA